jgi:type VI protein secretion system component Hcp
MGSGDRTHGVLRRIRHASLAPWKLLLPAAALLGAGAAVAIGDIPSSNGTITGCANTVGTNPISGEPEPYGQLRVLNPGDTTDPGNPNNCISVDEETVTWNQQGPAGPQGPQGPSGPGGANGANGASGSNGANGASGSVLAETNFSIDSSDSSRLYLKLDGLKGDLELKGTPDQWSQVSNTVDTTTGPAPARTAVNPTLKESEQQKKEAITGLVPLGSFAAGDESLNIGSQSTGAGAGKVVQTFVLTKASDKADALLNKDLFNHTVLKTLELIVTHGTGDKRQVQAADYTLSNVEITKIVDTGRSGKNAIEVIGAFTKMTGDLGTGTNTVPVSWNRVTNTESSSGQLPPASP